MLVISAFDNIFFEVDKNYPPPLSKKIITKKKIIKKYQKQNYSNRNKITLDPSKMINNKLFH